MIKIKIDKKDIIGQINKLKSIIEYLESLIDGRKKMLTWDKILEKIKEMKQGEYMTFETNEGYWSINKIEDYPEEKENE